MKQKNSSNSSNYESKNKTKRLRQTNNSKSIEAFSSININNNNNEVKPTAQIEDNSNANTNDFISTDPTQTESINPQTCLDDLFTSGTLFNEDSLNIIEAIDEADLLGYKLFDQDFTNLENSLPTRSNHEFVDFGHNVLSNLTESSNNFCDFNAFNSNDYFYQAKADFNQNINENNFACFNNNSYSDPLYSPKIGMNKTEQIRQHKKMIAYQKRLEKQRIKENKKILKAMLNENASNENSQFQIMPGKRGRKPKKDKFLSSEFINELCDNSVQAQTSMNLAQANSNSSLTNDLEDFFKLNHFNVTNKNKLKPVVKTKTSVNNCIVYSTDGLAYLF